MSRSCHGVVTEMSRSPSGWPFPGIKTSFLRFRSSLHFAHKLCDFDEYQHSKSHFPFPVWLISKSHNSRVSVYVRQSNMQLCMFNAQILICNLVYASNLLLQIGWLQCNLHATESNSWRKGPSNYWPKQMACSRLGLAPEATCQIWLNFKLLLLKQKQLNSIKLSTWTPLPWRDARSVFRKQMPGKSEPKLHMHKHFWVFISKFKDAMRSKQSHAIKFIPLLPL